MAVQPDLRNELESKDRATLSLLDALERSDAPSTQRGLAKRIGVALGLTNSLLKRAMSKGLVRVRQVPAKRFAYFVTPKGFSEKSRLVARYLSSSLDFFRRARMEYAQAYSELLRAGCTRIALYGEGELSEIAILSAKELDVELVGLVSPGSNRAAVLGVGIIPSLEAAKESGVDAVIITSYDHPQDAYDLLVKKLGRDKVHAVPLLHIIRDGEGGQV